MKEITKIGDRVRVRTINDEPSRTQQQFRDEVDVNNIIAKYRKTGEITHRARTSGVYADVSEITDYRESVQKVMDAQNAFMTLNADLRARFGNDPAAMLDFIHDPKNFDEGVKLGIFDEREKHKYAPAGPNDEQIKTNDDKAAGSKKSKASEPKDS